jgi:hypothetical protein
MCLCKGKKKMGNDCRTIRNHRNAGYILLLMLLVVILMGVFFTFKSWRGHGVKTEDGQELKNPPWKQWQDIQKHLDRSGLGKPASQQPKISEAIELTAPLFEDKNERGTITLMFRPDCTIKGGWQGKFFVDPNRSREFELAICEIKGYLVPDETYAGVEKRSEPEKIYFLSRGSFILVDYNGATGLTNKLTGYIFVSGWILPDYTIQQGQAFMTSDEEHCKLFTFSGKAEKASRDMEQLLKALQNK